MDLVPIASTAVSVLVPLFNKAMEKGAEKIGESVVGTFFDALKQRYAHTGAESAAKDLAKQPDDQDLQAALRVQLKKAIEAQPDLAAFLAQWIEQARQADGVATTQTLSVSGDDSNAVQIGNSTNVSVSIK